MAIKLELMDFKKLPSTTLDSGERWYETPDGNKYPSVTTILSQTADKSFLETWKKRLGEAKAAEETRKASARGNSLHGLCEKYVLGKEINLFREDSVGIDLFQQIRPILDENVTNVVGVEATLYSDELKVAGSSDLIAKFRNKRSIVDYKNSRRIKKKEYITDYFLQAAIYAMCFKERTGISIDQLVILIANVEINLPCIYIEKTSDWTDMARERISQYHLLTS